MPDFFVFQVIWVIGASMIVLAGLVHLPRWPIATFALALILGHNLLDGIKAARPGRRGTGSGRSSTNRRGCTLPRRIDVFPLYSLIPWVGVMAAGYALGPVLPCSRRAAAALAHRRRPCDDRRASSSFAPNLYGDPAPWAVQDGAARHRCSPFVNCEKYPPSLLYLAMTLGPALAAARAVPATVAPVRRASSSRSAAYRSCSISRISSCCTRSPSLVAGVFFGDAAWLFKGRRSSRNPRATGSVCPACTRSGSRR